MPAIDVKFGLYGHGVAGPHFHGRVHGSFGEIEVTLGRDLNLPVKYTDTADRLNLLWTPHREAKGEQRSLVIHYLPDRDTTLVLTTYCNNDTDGTPFGGSNEPSQDIRQSIQLAFHESLPGLMGKLKYAGLSIDAREHHGDETILTEKLTALGQPNPETLFRDLVRKMLGVVDILAASTSPAGTQPTIADPSQRRITKT
jgi:hypothetical protein